MENNVGKAILLLVVTLSVNFPICGMLSGIHVDKAVKSEKDCSICLEEVSPGAVLPYSCNIHEFHEECFSEWDKINKTCPTCRKYSKEHLKVLSSRLVESSLDGDLEGVKELMADGANVDILDDFMGMNALIAASSGGFLNIVDALLRSGKVDIEAKDASGSTALIQAAKKGHSDVVETLVYFGANVNSVTDGGNVTPLIAASASGHVGVVKILLEVGANKEIRTADKKDALVVATEMGYEEVVDALLEGSGRLYYHIDDIENAIESGSVNLVKNFIRAGASIYSTNREGLTPLMIAAKNGQTKIVSEILSEVKKDGYSNEDDYSEEHGSSLMLAIKNNHFATAQTIYLSHLYFQSSVSYSYFDLMFAIVNRDVDKIVSCYRNSSIHLCSKRERSFWTPLMLAADLGFADIVELLIDLGEEVDVATEEGYTALTFAAITGKSDVVDLLISKGSKFDNFTNGRYKRTPLMFASKNGYSDLVGLLIDFGANVNNIAQGCTIGFTPLMFASFGGHDSIVKRLANAGALVNKVALTDRQTALSQAVYSDNISTVRLLLELGANPSSIEGPCPVNFKGYRSLFDPYSNKEFAFSPIQSEAPLKSASNAAEFYKLKNSSEIENILLSYGAVDN